MVAGRKEIDKSAGIPVVINHPQKMVTWQDWRYETEDPEIIEWLKRHAMFSEIAGRPGTFWVFIKPRNLQAELDAKEAENAELRKKLGEPAPSSPSPEPVAPPLQASEVPAAPAPEAPAAKPPMCDSCDTKSVSQHKKNCPKNPKNIPTNPVAV